jgi:hypothetical protein
MHGRNNSQSLSMFSCMEKFLLIGVITVAGLFWLIGGQEWLTLTLVPVPQERQYDEILGPPDNPGWRRTLGVAMRADAVNDYFLQTLGEQGWEIEPTPHTSTVAVDYCLKGEHVLFQTVYIEIIGQKRGETTIDDSSIFIRANPEFFHCYKQP